MTEPTDSLDSEIDRIVGTFIALKYDEDTDGYSDGTLERWDNMKSAIKDLIATICNEVVGTTSEVEFDTLHNEYRNGAIVRNKLRAEQRSKLQELLNGR